MVRQRLEKELVKALKEIREKRGVCAFCKRAKINNRTFGKLERNKPSEPQIIARVKEQLEILNSFKNESPAGTGPSQKQIK